MQWPENVAEIRDLHRIFICKEKYLTQSKCLPIPTRVPTLNSEKSIFHSSNGNNGSCRKGEDFNTLFHAEAISSVVNKPEAPILWEL